MRAWVAVAVSAAALARMGVAGVCGRRPRAARLALLHASPGAQLRAVCAHTATPRRLSRALRLRWACAILPRSGDGLVGQRMGWCVTDMAQPSSALLSRGVPGALRPRRLAGGVGAWLLLSLSLVFGGMVVWPGAPCLRLSTETLVLKRPSHLPSTARWGVCCVGGAGGGQSSVCVSPDHSSHLGVWLRLEPPRECSLRATRRAGPVARDGRPRDTGELRVVLAEATCLVAPSCVSPSQATVGWLVTRGPPVQPPEAWGLTSRSVRYCWFCSWLSPACRERCRGPQVAMISSPYQPSSARPRNGAGVVAARLLPL